MMRLRYLIFLVIYACTLAFIFAGVVYNHYLMNTNALGQSQLSSVKFRLDLMTNEFEHVLNDLDYISHNELFRHMGNQLVDAETDQQISKILQSFIISKGHYNQIQLISNNGHQISQRQYQSEKLLAQKTINSDIDEWQKYVEVARQLQPGYVYASSMQLSMLNGEVEVPIKPVVHFSTAVYNNKKEPVGVLILSFLTKPMLQVYKQGSQNNAGKIFLLNADSYYLSSAQPEHDWSFMFADDAQYRFAEQFPETWNRLGKSNQGVIQSDEGIFAYSRISLSPEEQRIQQCDFCNIRAVVHIPPATLKKINFDEITRLSPIFFLVFIAGAIALWYIIKSLQLKQENEQQITLLNKIVKNERDLFINGPTIVFNWRDQYGWPVDYVSENIESVLGYSPASFIDNNLSYSSIVAPEFMAQIAEDIAHARQQQLKSFELRPYQVVDARGKRVWLRHFSTAIYDHRGTFTHYHGYVNDITQLKEAEDELKKSREYVHNLLETLPDPTVVIDVRNYQILLANESAKNLYNEGKPIPAGTTCHQMSHHSTEPCRGTDDPCPIQLILQHKKSAKVVHRHFTPENQEVYVELVSRPVFNESGEIIQIIESQRDVTHHIITEQRLTQQAVTDPLTETFNRLKFDNDLIELLDQSRMNQTYLGLIMFDLDNFKTINDSYGHDAGDEVLIKVTAIARDCIRKTDLLARWGGEEFMILLPGTQLNIVEKIAETLRQRIQQEYAIHPYRVTASFGVTLSSLHDSANDLKKRVDNALYQSKNEGKNRVTTLLAVPTH